MKRSEIISRLRDCELDLRARGVVHVALFGSRARGDERSDSDTDLLIDLDPDLDMSIYQYVGLKRYIAGLLEGFVDVIDRGSLKPHIRPPADSDAVYAF